MKKIMSLLLVISILLAFAACDAAKTESQNTDTTKLQETEPAKTETPPEETDPTQPDATEPLETDPIPAETEPSEPEETEVPVPPETEPEEVSKFPYTEYVAFADQPIYSGPGYDYDYVGPVGMAAQYTITEESEDSDGNIWGKLKSGAGWIDLTNSRYAADHREDNPPLLVAMRVADSTWADDYFIHDESEFAVRVAFIAGADLYYRLYEGDLTEFLQPGEFLTMGSIQKDQTLIAQLAFSGDFTTYLMEVETHKDIVVWYKIYESLEDGSIICEEL